MKATTEAPATSLLERDKCRVLVIDDNRDAADSLAMVLEAMGCPVRTGYCGADACVLIHEFQPHVAFLDIGMPDVSGWDLAEAIKLLERDNIVLAAITGWGAVEDVARSLNAGFMYHFTKPAELDALVSVVDHVCAAGPLRGDAMLAKIAE